MGIWNDAGKLDGKFEIDNGFEVYRSGAQGCKDAIGGEMHPIVVSFGSEHLGLDILDLPVVATIKEAVVDRIEMERARCWQLPDLARIKHQRFAAHARVHDQMRRMQMRGTQFRVGMQGFSCPNCDFDFPDVFAVFVLGRLLVFQFCINKPKGKFGKDDLKCLFLAIGKLEIEDVVLLQCRING